MEKQENRFIQHCTIQKSVNQYEGKPNHMSLQILTPQKIRVHPEKDKIEESKGNPENEYDKEIKTIGDDLL